MDIFNKQIQWLRMQYFYSDMIDGDRGCSIRLWHLEAAVHIQWKPAGMDIG